jgi:hypothetical protein
MMKLALMSTTTGEEDPELPLLQRIHYFKLTAAQIAAQIKCFRVQVTDTSQHHLFRGDCVNQAFMDDLLQRNQY